jgi:hypothetical protein
MMKLWKSNTLWEIVGYTTLALCIFGQITVGYIYLVAQFAYLAANALGIVRDFALDLPRANKVRDVVFTGITLALIVIKIF